MANYRSSFDEQWRLSKFTDLRNNTIFMDNLSLVLVRSRRMLIVQDQTRSYETVPFNPPPTAKCRGLGMFFDSTSASVQYRFRVRFFNEQDRDMFINTIKPYFSVQIDSNDLNTSTEFSQGSQPIDYGASQHKSQQSAGTKRARFEPPKRNIHSQPLSRNSPVLQRQQHQMQSSPLFNNMSHRSQPSAHSPQYQRNQSEFSPVNSKSRGSPVLSPRSTSPFHAASQPVQMHHKADLNHSLGISSELVANSSQNSQQSFSSMSSTHSRHEAEDFMTIPHQPPAVVCTSTVGSQTDPVDFSAIARDPLQVLEMIDFYSRLPGFPALVAAMEKALEKREHNADISDENTPIEDPMIGGAGLSSLCKDGEDDDLTESQMFSQSTQSVLNRYGY